MTISPTSGSTKKQQDDIDSSDDGSLSDGEHKTFESSSKYSTLTVRSSGTNAGFEGIENWEGCYWRTCSWRLGAREADNSASSEACQGHFRVQILNVYGNADFSIKFVRQYRLENNIIVFPEKEDVADIDIEQIVEKVKPSTILWKGVL